MRENAFQNILDNNTAYWLGFLTADGSISKTTIQIELANKDKPHLEKLRDFLELDKPICERIKCSNGKEYVSNYLAFNSRHMIEDLAQYKIVPGKTYLDIDFFSFINEPYKFSYICGYLDGDGWIVHTLKSRAFGICGNQKTITSIGNYLNNRYNWDLIVTQSSTSPRIFLFQTTATTKLKQFLTDYCELYGTCDLLERKYNNAISILEELYFASHISSSFRNEFKKDEDKTYTKICPVCGIEFHPLYSTQKCCSQKCSYIKQQRVERPNREILKNEIRSTPFLQLSKKYNVGDATISRWCKSYGLPYRMRVIKKMTDEEWEKA